MILAAEEKKSGVTADIPACNLNRSHEALSLAARRHIETCRHIWIQFHDDPENAWNLKLFAFFLICEIRQSVSDDA